MFSIFFIRRPVFAAVISIFTVVIGLIALTSLPIARYPDIGAPTITIEAVYPGADAKTISETVASPIEQEVNGVEGMIYMSSVSANNGRMQVTVTFAPGTDLDTANVLVQNRVAVAESKLPEEVKRQGVTVQKKSSSVIMYVGIHSPNGTFDDQYLSNFTYQRIKDELTRVKGVGGIQVFGAGQLSMRIWLDPEKIASYGLGVSDVVQAIRAQNVQAAAGRIGAAPTESDVSQTLTVTVKGRLSEVGEFEKIVVKTGDDGSLVRLADVARVAIGSNLYDIQSKLNGKPSSTMGISQLPGSNILDVASGITNTLDELAKSFPDDLEYSIIYDNTNVVRASIKEVVETLIIALLLVIFTVYIFLQDFRATIIPAITIPVALIGTFAVLLAFGFSLNQLTLFGLVLVIGIVVDDAIVVVENTSRWIAEGLEPKEAAEKAMKEVAGPVIATTLVLLAVFVPTTFLSGITGTLFKQFAVTISIATVFSSINALTLSPALCALILRKRKREPRGLFKLFNWSLDLVTRGYLKITSLAIRTCVIAIILFIGLSIAAIWGLNRLPTGFVPQEDEGWCIIHMQMPDGTSLPRTAEATEKINAIVANTPGVADYLTITGYSIVDSSATTNTAFFIASFKPWDERTDPSLSQEAIVGSLNKSLFLGFREGIAFAFPTPSLPGVGTSGGFTFMLQDRAGVGLESLEKASKNVVIEANGQVGLAGVNSTFSSGVPTLQLEIDREQVLKSGLSLSKIFETLQVYLGSAYVNDFTQFGRVFQVTAQADEKFRNRTEVIRDLKFPSPSGEMVPIGAIATVKEVFGPQIVSRFNLYPSVKITGQAKPGFSSGQALGIMEDLADKTLPDSMGYSWSELSYQEKLASGGMGAIFIFAIFIVYLFLAAQYESWTLPISVILAVPTALLGAVIAVTFRGYDNNVYTQIGIVLLIGLSTKSAILIVEFAKELREQGKSIYEAAMESTRLRFRAVLMTALSFVLGVIPLLVASGAGAESQKVIGTAVFGGMIVATLVSLAAVPMFFFAIQTTTEFVSADGRATRKQIKKDKAIAREEAKKKAKKAKANSNKGKK